MNTLDREQFVASTGQHFHIQLDTPRSIRLTAVSPMKECGPAFESFSVLFDADAAGSVLPQGTYTMHNDSLGHAEIFIVPVRNPQGETNKLYYEAVFSRQKTGTSG